MREESDLSGFSVLVVEDDFYLATDAAHAVQSAGATVIGPCSTEQDARNELKHHRPDAVVLDINLGPGASFELAEHLKENAIPFIFVTGYDRIIIPAKFGSVERIEKPVQFRQIVGAVSRLVSSAA